jgi:hypothetical protein
MPAKLPERPNCHFLGPQIGKIKCNCSGAAVAYTCWNSAVPSRVCTPRQPQQLTDGPLKLKDGTLTKQRYITFPFTAHMLQRGDKAWDTWLLICEVCPWRQQPPAEIVLLQQQIVEIKSRIERYEKATTLEERESAVSVATEPKAG